MLSKVKFYENLVVKENQKMVITNEYLAKFVGKLWRKYSFKFESYDEFMGSIGYLIWVQIERSDFDFDNLDDKTVNQIYKSITKMLTFQIYEDANKDMKRINGDFVIIDFVSLDADLENDNSLSEMVEESFFGSKGKTAKTPFVEWLDAEAESILSEKQNNVLKALRKLPHDASKAEIESSTGISIHNISTRKKTIARKINKAWEKRSFENTYIYRTMMSEINELNSFLDLEEGYEEVAHKAISDMSKLGVLLLDELNHQELIELNKGGATKKTMYKVISITVKRIEKLNTLIIKEESIWSQKEKPSIISATEIEEKKKTSFFKMDSYGSLN